MIPSHRTNRLTILIDTHCQQAWWQLNFLNQYAAAARRLVYRVARSHSEATPACSALRRRPVPLHLTPRAVLVLLCHRTMVPLLKAGLRQLSVPHPSVTAAHLPDTLSNSSVELLCYVNACRSLTSPTQPQRSCSLSARLFPHQRCQWSRTTSVQFRHIPTTLQMLLQVQVRLRMGN